MPPSRILIGHPCWHSCLETLLLCKKMFIVFINNISDSSSLIIDIFISLSLNLLPVLYTEIKYSCTFGSVFWENTFFFWQIWYINSFPQANTRCGLLSSFNNFIIVVHMVCLRKYILQKTVVMIIHPCRNQDLPLLLKETPCILPIALHPWRLRPSSLPFYWPRFLQIGHRSVMFVALWKSR